jgi:prepilin-type N-terminal cleavage/methylation domain-containing protein
MMSFRRVESGFSLLEIILVLAIIGAIASAILPGLSVTIDSKASISITNLSSQIRATYDNAVFTGRMNRIVVDLREGEFWTELAPPGYRGRAPAFEEDDSDQLAEKKKAFLNYLSDKMKSEPQRPMATMGKNMTQRYYSNRSLLEIQKKVLSPPFWSESKDDSLSRHALASGVVFYQFASVLSRQPLKFAEVISNSEKDPKRFGYIYFLPDGTLTPTSIQIAMVNKEQRILDNDLKYTLNLNTLTGQVYLLEGFQEANFKNAKY